MTRDQAAQPLIAYSDFNCPFCYAMHERLHGRGLMKDVEWRGVQHAPHLSIPMARWHSRLMEELRHEVAMVMRLAPGLPIALPSGKPNTRPVIQAAAWLLARDAGAGSRFVRRLYQIFWREGRDISDPFVLTETLQSLGVAEPLPRATDTATTARIEHWDNEWRKTGQAGVPLLVRRDGMLLVGLSPDEDIDRFVKGA
jgi:predicted DsbA family dithiol-disulfide isomerase